MALNLPLKKIPTELSIPREHSVIVYKHNNNDYAKNENGSIICQNSQTACIQEAINYLKQFGGGKILVKKGTYRPTSTINIPDDINLIIEGEGNNTVFKYTDPFILFLHLPTANNKWSSVLIFKNMKIDRTGSDTNNATVFYTSYAKYVKYENIEIVDEYRDTHGDIGIYGYNNFAAIAEKNRIYNKGGGIGLYGHIAVLKENYVQNTAKAGIIGGGYLPNYAAPPGYYGGITIIENNICIDCGITDEAISVDYWTTNPVQEAIAIIRNNLILSKTAAINIPIQIVNVSQTIIENNKIYGSTKYYAIYCALSRYTNHITLRNNIIDIRPNRDSMGIQLASRNITIENNDIRIISNLPQNLSHIVELWTTNLIFKNNRITVTTPSNFYTGYALIHRALETTNAYSLVSDNIINVPVNPSLTIATLFYITLEVVTTVYFERNYIKSTTLQNYFTGFSSTANTIYRAYVNKNVVDGILSNKIRVYNSNVNATTTLIIDTDAEIVSCPNCVVKFPKRSSGTATINSGATRITVNHNLISAPSKVLITPLGQPAGKLWIEDINKTSFDIVTDTAPSTNLNIAWYAEI